METVFISGSISIKKLDDEIIKRINTIVNSNFEIFIGDADGADTAVQAVLNNMGYSRVTVYCSGNHVRNNFGGWPVRKVMTKHKSGTRQFFTAKDLSMGQKCDYGLMIWDAKSTGTLSNVFELLNQDKKSLVFVDTLKLFYKITGIEDFEKLTAVMSADDFEKADKKMRLRKKIQGLKFKQRELFDTNTRIDPTMDIPLQPAH